MKKKIICILKYLSFILIPFLSVFLCVFLSIAQGEKNEEIVFGIMLGILLDFIYWRMRYYRFYNILLRCDNVTTEKLV